MDDGAVYAVRLELVDFLIDALWDTPREEFLANVLGDVVVLPDDEVSESLDRGFSSLEDFIEGNRGRPVEEVREELTAEYTRVFVGPRPPVLAHETYYRDDTQFIGEGLAEVEASYAAAGWKPPEEYPEENDFVAVELAFLRDLIDRQRHGQEEAFGYERVFLDEHLTRWIDGMAADLLAETDEPFYRAAAHVAKGLVELEDEIVAQMVSG